MDPFNFMHQHAQGSAGQPRSTSSFDARYLTAQPGTLLQQRAVDETFLDLSDLDDIIGGGLYISPDANYLLPPQTTLPAPYQPPSSAPTTAPPPSFYPPTAPAPPSPIPATKQPIPWKLQVAGVVDLGLDRKTHEHRFRLPLPRDVDKAFDKLRITVGGKRGFRIDSCVGLKHKDHPNHTILNSVDHAGMILDQLIPGPNVVIQRGALPEEKLSVQTQAPTKKEPPYGFTLAHLLTVICRKHYNALNHSSVKAPEKLEGSPHYEWLWIVSVTRSDGREGPIRWFPELEVRIPPEWWNAPATALGTSSSPGIPRLNPRTPHTTRSPPRSPTAYSPYPSPGKTQPQQSHSDRLHKRTPSAVASVPHSTLPNFGPTTNMKVPRPQAMISGPILVPLPDDVNPRVRYPVYSRGDPGQRGVCLHGTHVTTRAEKLLEHLRQTIMDADRPLIYGPEVTHTIVERGLFPGERGGGSGRPIKERNETGVWTLADVLMRVLLKQREWYWNELRNAAVQHLIASSQYPAWIWWTQRGMHADSVWIVAIRQTLPDHKGLTRWIPELELRDR